MSVKTKIIDAAYELFCEFGYEKTSVQAIVDKAETSKGGFYHHFNTKEDVVKAIACDFIEVLELRYKTLLEDTKKSVCERINSIFHEVITYKKTLIISWPGITKMLSFEGNTRIIQSMAARFEKVTADVYYTFIAQGIKDKLFVTQYPKQVAKLIAREMIHVYSLITKVILAGDNKTYDEFVASLEFTENILNNALGLKEHKILVKDEALKYLEHVKQNYKNEVIK